MTSPKLPALTRAEIEALPDGFYMDNNGAPYRRVTNHIHTIWYCGATPESVQEIMERGGITARLVDPKPLVELLREAQYLLLSSESLNIDWDDCSQELIGRIEAALAEFDTENTNG